MTETLTVIPFRDRGDPARSANLRVVLDHLAETTDWRTVVVSDGEVSSSVPFNRSAAYNRAIANRSADVVVYHESDMLLPPSALQEAVDKALERPGLVVPFNTYRYLDESVTDLVRSGLADPFSAPFVRHMLNGQATGAVNVVSRETLEAVGRWDDHFSGWGYDDRAMTRAFAIATGTATRYVNGFGVHLYHTPGWQQGGSFAGGARRVPQLDAAATAANKRRYDLYVKARTPQRIRELTGGALT